ncbi:FecR family protein [Mangrovibacterium marinum]|uniref:FecR family protein n=1 Tax=Mangrovibacterium marinum TaxID=1639118 RepID=A0A2T5BT97_9BACT|nr:FecR family protein [Mangrovibacterium marinum]PTN02624.1 FecR family protein [Mangrovibacterium marinum]
MHKKEINRIDAYYKSSSKNDEDFVIESFSNNKNTDILRKLAQEQWNESSEEKVSLQHLLKKLHQTIVHTQPRKPKTTTIIFNFYSKVAAVMLVPLLIAGLYVVRQNVSYANSITEIESPMGSRVHFKLPDGSAGVLNGGSNLSYTADFVKNRNIQLTGEAYFEVAKDKQHPFTVKTTSADIRVLGTKFDVCAYPEAEDILTTLEEGQVQIYNKKQGSTELLSPGEQNVIRNSSGLMTTRQVETQLYTSWRKDVLRIDNTSFEKVVKLMERWYGVNIELAPELKQSQNYTLTIKTESLREMLQLLKLTTPFNYQINGNKVTITKANI